MDRVRSAIVSAAIGALPVLALCLFTTLAIYAGNSDEFSASFLAILRVYLPYIAATIGVLGLLALPMTDDGVRRYRAVLAAVAILFWLQGSILVWDYGVLDGRDIDWLAGIWRGALDAAIWIVVLMFAISAFRRFGKTLVTAAVVVLAIQSVGAIMTAASSASDLVDEPENQIVVRFPQSGEADLKLGTNLIVLLTWLFFRAVDFDQAWYFLDSFVHWQGSDLAGRFLGITLSFMGMVVLLALAWAMSQWPERRLTPALMTSSTLEKTSKMCAMLLSPAFAGPWM